MHRLISIDTSGLDALQQLHRVLKRRGIALVLANVNEQPLSLMRRSGFEAVIGADAIVPNLAAWRDGPVRRCSPTDRDYQNGSALRSAASAGAAARDGIVALVRPASPAQTSPSGRRGAASLEQGARHAHVVEGAQRLLRRRQRASGRRAPRLRVNSVAPNSLR